MQKRRQKTKLRSSILALPHLLVLAVIQSACSYFDVSRTLHNRLLYFFHILRMVLGKFWTKSFKLAAFIKAIYFHKDYSISDLSSCDKIV